MTEQEIVECLKENKTRGVAFVFMPKEVKEWACDNSRFIIYYNKFGWDNYSSNIEIYKPTDVIALPEDFKLKEELQGEWVEFEIDQQGNFHCFKDGDIHYFFWANWGIFLKAFSGEYTAFGGWQYEGSERWYLVPAVKLHDELWNSYVIEESEDATPDVPIKIRFWREK